MDSPSRQAAARRALVARHLPWRRRLGAVIRDRVAAVPLVCAIRGGVLPALVVPGAMRCGTTSLFGYLAGHPQLAPSRRKEVHYFDLRFQLGPAWYRGQFPRPGRDACGRRRLAFESSPYYLFDPRVPARLHELVPDARLVFLLRDPADRAYSHWRKNRRDGREPLSFADALDAEDDRLAGEEERMLADPRFTSPLHQYYSYRRRGLYAEQLARWRLHFPERRMLVVDSGRLFAEPARVFREVIGFLGLDPWEPSGFAVRNEGGGSDPADDDARARLRSWFADHERRLAEVIGWCPSRSRAVPAA